MKDRQRLKQEIDRLKTERLSYLYYSWADIERMGFDKLVEVAKLHGKIEVLEWVLADEEKGKE